MLENKRIIYLKIRSYSNILSQKILILKILAKLFCLFDLVIAINNGGAYIDER